MSPTPPNEPAKIQRYVGYIAALAFLVIAYQSMSPDLTLAWPVILGIIIIIAMLLGRLEKLSELLANWNTKKHIRVDQQAGEDDDDAD